MAIRKETYPDIESVKSRIEYMHKFGWIEHVNITSRGVYEVEFTRDESIPKNRELKKYESMVQQANTALEFIERYQTKSVNKKAFKTFNKLTIFVLIYIIITFLMGTVVCSVIKFGYYASPEIVEKLDLNVTIDGEEVPLDESWSMTIDLLDTEYANITPFLNMLGINHEIVINVDFILNIIFGFGIFFGVIALAIIIFIIYRKAKTTSYYKAEVRYIENRKQLLDDKVYDLQKEISNIMLKVESL